MIIVANKKSHKKSPMYEWYIGRPSALGNPFVIGRDGTREDVIIKYDVWIRDQLQLPDSMQSIEFRQLRALAEKADVMLLCWCAPLPCHGDVLQRLLDESIAPT